MSKDAVTDKTCSPAVVREMLERSTSKTFAIESGDEIVLRLASDAVNLGPEWVPIGTVRERRPYLEVTQAVVGEQAKSDPYQHHQPSRQEPPRLVFLGRVVGAGSEVALGLTDPRVLNLFAVRYADIDVVVYRRSIDSRLDEQKQTITAVRALHDETQKKLAEATKALKDAEEKAASMDKALSQAKRERTYAEDQLGSLRERTRAMEGDLAKVRDAVGTLKYNEIVGTK